jgi:hypothetical protein
MTLHYNKVKFISTQFRWLCVTIEWRCRRGHDKRKLKGRKGGSIEVLAVHLKVKMNFPIQEGVLLATYSGLD